MNARGLLLAVLWIASLGLAWMAGSQFGASTAPHADRKSRDDHTEGLPERRGGRTALEMADSGGSDSTTSSSRAAGAEAAPLTPEEEAFVFTLEGVETIEDLSARFMRYADIKLRQGPEGQMELLRKMDELTQDESVRMLLRDEREGMKLMYPWIRFLIDREEHVLEMSETVYRKAAEEPAAFEGMDDNTLEIFTEGVAWLLPSAVDDETLGRYREYAQAILALPEDTLPKAIRKNFSELRRNLEYWAGPLSGEELLAQLADAALPIEEKLRLLTKARAEDLEGFDLVGLLEQPLAEGNRRVIGSIGRIPLSGSNAVALDRAFFLGVEKGKVRGWEIRGYLGATGRLDWAQARPFIEEGLRRGTASASAFAQSLVYLREVPPKAFVEGVLATYAIDEGTASMLRKRFGIQ